MRFDNNEAKRKGTRVEEEILGTHHAVDDCVFSEKNDLSRGAYEPLKFFVLPSFKIKLIDRAAEGVRFGNSNKPVFSGIECDGACVDEGMFQIVQEVLWIFDTHTKTDQVFWQATSGPRSGIDRSMSGTFVKKGPRAHA